MKSSPSHQNSENPGRETRFRLDWLYTKLALMLETGAIFQSIILAIKFIVCIIIETQVLITILNW